MLYFTTNMTQPQLAIASTIIDKSQNRMMTTETFNEQLNKRASVAELSIEKLKELYLETLTPKEHKSYIIARDHLGMSFTLEKSVGFLQFIEATRNELLR
jgi:hypothetical protein